jgi:hypothetical protein
MNHPPLFGNPQDPGLHRGQCAIGLPPLEPAMRGAFRRPTAARMEHRTNDSQ